MIKLFDTPVDASAFIGGFDLCKGVELVSTNYAPGSEQGYVVRLVRPDDTVSEQVVGIPEDSPAEVAAAGHCRAYIASRS